MLLPIKYLLPKKPGAVFPNLAKEEVYQILQTVDGSKLDLKVGLYLRYSHFPKGKCLQGP